MRFMIKVSFPTERGNELLRDPQFGHKVEQLLADIKAEASYFCPVDGKRGMYIILNMNDASELAAKAEPLFLWLHADIEAVPVMKMEDLAKAGPAIGAAAQKWV
jgi:hypothetical protein